MNRRNYLGRIALVALAVVVLMAAGVTLAADHKNTESILSSGDTFNGAYTRAAAVVRIDGTVDGNVFVAGNEVSIDGTVNGDVYAVGQNVSVKGKVSGTVHVAGARVDVAGQVGNMLLAAGSSVTVSKDAKIGRGLMAAGSIVDVGGPVGGAAYIAASRVNINSTIDGDTSLSAAHITLGKDAHIDGNLKYNDSAQTSIANDGNVTGSISKYHVNQPKQKALADLTSKVLFGIVSTFLVGLVLTLIAPATVVATSEYIQSHALKSTLIGMAVLIVVPVAAVLLLVTIFGIPLAVLIGMTYVAALIISNVFVALWLGRRIGSTKGVRPGANIWALLMGLVALEVLTILPAIGGLASFAALVIGLGAIAGRSYDRLKATRAKQVAVK